MRQNLRRAVFTISAVLFVACVIRAGVRGHASVYVGGTLSGIEKGARGQLDTGDKALAFSPGKGDDFNIPYTQITAMDYGEHAGRRLAAALFVAWPLLVAHQKGHYLTVYLNRDEANASETPEQTAQDPNVAP